MVVSSYACINTMKEEVNEKHHRSWRTVGLARLIKTVKGGANASIRQHRCLFLSLMPCSEFAADMHDEGLELGFLHIYQITVNNLVII